MKKKYPVILLSLIFMLLTAGNLQKKIVEKMEISRVIVQFRVFEGKKPVNNLGIKHFTLYENRRPEKIEQVILVKNKIGIHNISLTPQNFDIKQYPSRYFVLLFKIVDFNNNLVKGINYFFDKIIRVNDDLLVFINNRTLLLDSSERNLIKRKEILLAALKEQAETTRTHINLYSSRLNQPARITEINQLTTNTVTLGPKFIDYINNYLGTIREYVQRFLTPDLDNYYNFAQFLSKIKKKKWVINFIQMGIFPRMEMTLRNFDRIKREILRSDVDLEDKDVFISKINSLFKQIDAFSYKAEIFPTAAINKLFYKVKTTFHTIYIKNPKFLYQSQKNPISSNLLKNLEILTKNTGGRLLITDQIDSALHQISLVEDYYYLLVYSPKNSAKIGKLKIKTANPSYRIIYDNSQRADYIADYLKKRHKENPQIQIKNIRFITNKLSFIIKDFFKNRQKNKRGKIFIKILIKNSNNKVEYNKSRIITARKAIISVSLNFNWLNKGKHYAIVEAVDLYNQKSAMQFLQVSVD